MAGELRDYAAWIDLRPCCAPKCKAQYSVQGHHPKNGLMAPPGQPLPPKSVGRKPGKGQRCHDYYLIPLCVECHQALHAKSGQFKDWSKQRLDAWQLEQVTYHRFLWDEAQGTEESTQAWLDGLPF